MIERLPTPWGLVRLGVAPDHPKMKTVSRAFEKIAARPGFRFLGNVEVGRDVGHDELARLYDAVLYAVGSQSDRRLGIPGEDLPGLVGRDRVRRLVQRPPRPPGRSPSTCRRARRRDRERERRARRRPHARADREELAPTDTTDAAIAAIVASRLREIVVLGRRGPVQAAWTTTELGSSGSSPARTSSSTGRARARPGERGGARGARTRAAEHGDPPWVRGARAGRQAEAPSGCASCVSPVAILGDERVEAVEIARNRLEPDGGGSVRAVATDEREVDPVRRRVPQRRLPGRRASRTFRSTSAPARSRTTAVACSPRTGPRSPVCTARGGSSAARRGHRDEQEGCDGHRRAPARGRPCGASAHAVETRRRRRAARRARRRRRDVRGVGSDRPARTLAGRAAGTPARQAADLGRAARGRALRLRARRASGPRPPVVL